MAKRGSYTHLPGPALTGGFKRHARTNTTGGTLAPSPRNKNPAKANNEPLPKGSGFDRIVKKRADRLNMPGKTNHFGDRVLDNTVRKNTIEGSERFGKSYRTVVDRKGRNVHVYGSGKNAQRIVLKPKKNPTFKYL